MNEQRKLLTIKINLSTLCEAFWTLTTLQEFLLLQWSKKLNLSLGAETI